MIKLKHLIENTISTNPHSRYAQESGAGQFDPRSFGLTETMSFREIKKKYDPTGTKHDLALKCVKCGTTDTCRCTKPKHEVNGTCNECAASDGSEHRPTGETMVDHPIF